MRCTYVRIRARPWSRHAICANVLIARLPGEHKTKAWIRRVCQRRPGPRDRVARHACVTRHVRVPRSSLRPAELKVTRRSTPRTTTCTATCVLERGACQRFGKQNSLTNAWRTGERNVYRDSGALHLRSVRNVFGYC